MRALFFVLLLACVGGKGCAGNKERTYTLKLWDGRTVEACAYAHSWEGANCLQLYDMAHSPTTLICEVKSAEFGLPVPRPPAEATPEASR